MTYIKCFKCIIKCFNQLVFKVGQFVDSKLIYLLNYCRFCDFDPFRGHFLAILRPFDTLNTNKSKLTYIECLKCILKCLYQLVFKFCQFLDSKWTYLLNYCRFCKFDPRWGLPSTCRVKWSNNNFVGLWQA